MLIIQSAIATAFLLSRASSTTPDNVTSRLQVQIPQSLFKEDGYDHREALFGNPPYGGSISQNVYLAGTDLCDANEVNPNGGYPTRGYIDGTTTMQPWPSPFILMADRGGCSFVQKARNAQHAGAAAFIIADNLCLCSDVACLNSTGITDGFVQCENTEPIMADDGSGGDISISTFLMFKTDADKIKTELKDRDNIVQLEMSWALPHPDNKVEYELWTVPSEEVSKPFQKEWKNVAQKLGANSRFTPHQFIYDGVRTRCHGADGRNLCFNLCTNNGRYCATDPDNDLENGITGAEVVNESLRRICVWKYYGQEDGLGEKYWDYITEFLKRCDSDDFFANKDCVNDVYKNAKIDGKRIDSCMEDSGGVTNDQVNTLLEREIDAADRRGVVVLPTMFVNTAPLRGSLSTNIVFNAVCAGFHEGTLPEICSKCSGCGDVSACVNNKGVCTSSPGGASSGDATVSKKTFGMTLLAMCALFGGIGYVHWRKTREEMRDQVRGILAEYMPLEGGDDEHHSPMDFARQGQGASLIS